VPDIAAVVDYLNTVSDYNVAMRKKKKQLPAFFQYLKSLLVTFISLFFVAHVTSHAEAKADSICITPEMTLLTETHSAICL